MIKQTIRTKCIALGVLAAAFTGAGTTMSFAALPLDNQATGAVVQTPQRQQAIHDCSVEASKWSFSTWQSTQIVTYDDCMANHGQPE